MIRETLMSRREGPASHPSASALLYGLCPAEVIPRSLTS